MTVSLIRIHTKSLLAYFEFLHKVCTFWWPPLPITRTVISHTPGWVFGLPRCCTCSGPLTGCYISTTVACEQTGSCWSAWLSCPYIGMPLSYIHAYMVIIIYTCIYPWIWLLSYIHAYMVIMFWYFDSPIRTCGPVFCDYNCKVLNVWVARAHWLNTFCHIVPLLIFYLIFLLFLLAPGLSTSTRWQWAKTRICNKFWALNTWLLAIKPQVADLKLCFKSAIIPRKKNNTRFDHTHKPWHSISAHIRLLLCHASRKEWLLQVLRCTQLWIAWLLHTSEASETPIRTHRNEHEQNYVFTARR